MELNCSFNNINVIALSCFCHQVILGSGINDLSMIVHENNDIPMNYSITTEILDCGEWRAFWISWDKVGEDSFMYGMV